MKPLKIVLAIATIAAFQHQSVSAQMVSGNELESEILKILENYDIPGAGVALISMDSTIWIGILGHADVTSRIPSGRFVNSF